MRSILFRLSALSMCSAFAPLRNPALANSARRSMTTSLQASDKPFAVVVQATIEPDRMAEFLKLIQTNAEETRKEPGCIRFDVLRSQESPNEFFFYELYEGPEAIDYHKVSHIVLEPK